jgi:hypothetical protein
MAKTHNKKRNVGIIYEQIMSFICERLMEDSQIEAQKAINIVKENFNKNSQLYKEFKLFKALSETHNITDNLANLIISEAKSACNNMFDSQKLEKEKSKLIKDLNYTFGKGVIFEQNVSNYKIYATIQTLLNEWRNNDNNFDKITEYEIVLHESLTKKQSKIKEDVVQPNNLTRKLMKEIFDKKYKNILSESQKRLINLYTNEKDEVVTEAFLSIKNNCLELFENYMKSCNNRILNDKYSDIKEKLSNLDENDISKENLNKFLVTSKLSEEILGE